MSLRNLEGFSPTTSLRTGVEKHHFKCTFPPKRLFMTFMVKREPINPCYQLALFLVFLCKSSKCSICDTLAFFCYFSSEMDVVLDTWEQSVTMRAL